MVTCRYEFVQKFIIAHSVDGGIFRDHKTYLYCIDCNIEVRLRPNTYSDDVNLLTIDQHRLCAYALQNELHRIDSITYAKSSIAKKP